MIAGRLFLAHDRNVMIGSVHGRTHKIGSAGIQSDILFINVFFMNGFCHQTAIGSHHETAHFRAEAHISHARRNQYLFVHSAHAVADGLDIIRLLIRPVGNAHSSGQIDKGNVTACLFLKFYRHFKQNFRQRRIIFVGHRIDGQKSVTS